MVGNKWWNNLKSKCWSFEADYSRQPNLAAQKSFEKKVHRPIKSSDIFHQELPIRKDQFSVLRGRLKRMSSDTTNMATEFHAEEARNASSRHIARNIA